jgi:hypothetical protein
MRTDPPAQLSQIVFRPFAENCWYRCEACLVLVCTVIAADGTFLSGNLDYWMLRPVACKRGSARRRV